MSLVESFFPVRRQSHNYFDHMFAEMQRGFENLDQEMNAMRQRMFQLVPVDRNLPRDVEDMAILPSHPVVEEHGISKLKLQFDVHQYKPEEVKVKVVGGHILQIEAEHEHKTETSHEKRQYFRQYHLPEGIDVSQVNPSLTKDGVLTVEAPAPALKPQERLVPIEFKK